MKGCTFMNILYVTTIGGTMPFFKRFIKELIESGHCVDLACNTDLYPVPDYFGEWGCDIYNLSCTRDCFDFRNVKAILEITKIIKNKTYSIVHCHTPIASICTRIACSRSRKYGTKVFYTVHGFHFYKGAPLKNWLIYYPIEWICSFYTDELITINREDFRLAKKKMHAKSVQYVPGVGIVLMDTDSKLSKENKRKELGLAEDDFILLSVGELNDNKNHITVIRALKELKHEKIKYLICGKGEKEEFLLKEIKYYKLEKRVKLLGFRTDVKEIMKAVDCFIHPSFREGLPVSIMEAMELGLPVITSNIRGCQDLIIDQCGGFLCDPDQFSEFKDAITRIFESPELCCQMKKYNLEHIKKFDMEHVNQVMRQKVYRL